MVDIVISCSNAPLPVLSPLDKRNINDILFVSRCVDTRLEGLLPVRGFPRRVSRWAGDPDDACAVRTDGAGQVRGSRPGIRRML